MLGPVPLKLSWLPAALVGLALFAGRGEAQPASSPAVDTVYILPSSHWDLGFLRPPDQQMDAIKPHLDAVIQACERDADFRWTIESVWQLNVWLQRTKDQALIERMGALLRRGQIELSAADGSLHTEFTGSEELNRLIYASHKAGARFGIKPTVAMMNDTPGFSSRVTQVLARSDVPYMITGSNTAIGGGLSLGRGMQPFYWEGPDGSKVLLWQTQSTNGGYTEGVADYPFAPAVEDPYKHTRFVPKEWEGLSDLEITRRGVDKLLAEYRAAGYRHSALAVMFMHDGVGPEDESTALLPNVRAWNAAGMKPRLVIATPSEFFAAMVKREDPASFPTFRGDWNGLWARVKVNSPSLSAEALMLQDRLPEAETLHSLLRLSRKESDPPADLAAAYRDLFIYDEHNGAAQGGWPDVMTRAEVSAQNEQYAGKLVNASRTAQHEIDAGLLQFASQSVRASDEQRFLVFNPSSWVASRITCLRGVSGARTLRDVATGRTVSLQTMSDGSKCFHAAEVPALGYRSYLLQASAHSLPARTKQGGVLESPFYRVDFDASGEIVRILDKGRGQVVMDATQGGEAGVLKAARGSAPAGEVHRAVLSHESGPVLDRMTIDRAGTLRPRVVVTLPQNEPRILITETLDRAHMPFVPYGQPSIEYAIGFKASPPASQLLVEDGNGVMRFPQETLPGARTDAVVPRHAIAWSSPEAHLLLSQKDSFFDRVVPNGVEVSVITKSDQTKTKDQGVQTFETFEPEASSLRTFSFTLEYGAGPADPVAVYRSSFAEDTNEVLLLPPTRSTPQPTGSLLWISGAGVVVLDVKPDEDGVSGHYTMRLQEIAGKQQTISVNLPDAVQEIAEVMLTEDRVLQQGVHAEHIQIGPHQTLTLRLSTAPLQGGER